MDPTNHHSAPANAKTVLLHFYVLPTTYYEGMELEEICPLDKCQPSSGNCYIEHYIVEKLVPVK